MASGRLAGVGMAATELLATPGKTTSPLSGLGLGEVKLGLGGPDRVGFFLFSNFLSGLLSVFFFFFCFAPTKIEVHFC